MSDLLAAVAADPDADLPRLVYADWLDDRGDSIRAEFIRLQVQLAKLDARPQWERNRDVHLYQRQQELLDNHRAELLGDLVDLPDNPVDVVFERGFLASVNVDAGLFLRLADRLAARVPLPRIRVGDAADRAFELLASPHLGVIARLGFDHPAAGWDDAPPEAFPDALGAMAGDFVRLEELDLRYCGLLDGDVPTVFPSDGFPRLADLGLAGNFLTDAGVVALLGTGLPRRLTRLVLDGNPVGDQAAFELADRLGKVATFRVLDFRRTNVTSVGYSALSAAFGSRCNPY